MFDPTAKLTKKKKRMVAAVMNNKNASDSELTDQEPENSDHNMQSMHRINENDF